MRLVWIVMAAVLLAACGTRYPLGMGEEEWNGLSTEQQLEARKKQAELDRVEAARRALEAEHRARAEEARRQELVERRANARYGDIVQCVVENGKAKLYSDWRAIQPAAVSLLRGEGAEFEVTSSDGRRSRDFRAEFSEDGMTVTLCPGSGSYGCGRLVGTAQDFRKGIARKVTVGSSLEAHMRCGFAPGRRGSGYLPR